MASGDQADYFDYHQAVGIALEGTINDYIAKLEMRIKPRNTRLRDWIKSGFQILFVPLFVLLTTLSWESEAFRFGFAIAWMAGVGTFRYFFANKRSFRLDVNAILYNWFDLVIILAIYCSIPEISQRWIECSPNRACSSGLRTILGEVLFTIWLFSWILMSNGMTNPNKPMASLSSMSFLLFGLTLYGLINKSGVMPVLRGAISSLANRYRMVQNYLPAFIYSAGKHERQGYFGWFFAHFDWTYAILIGGAILLVALLLFACIYFGSDFVNFLARLFDTIRNRLVDVKNRVAKWKLATYLAPNASNSNVAPEPSELEQPAKTEPAKKFDGGEITPPDETARFAGGVIEPIYQREDSAAYTGDGKSVVQEKQSDKPEDENSNANASEDLAEESEMKIDQTNTNTADRLDASFSSGSK